MISSNSLKSRLAFGLLPAATIALQLLRACPLVIHARADKAMPGAGQQSNIEPSVQGSLGECQSERSRAMHIGFIWFLCATAIALMAQQAEVAAADSDPGRIAIIDASDPTTKFLGNFKEAGVLVIGRYFGRCDQWTGKRMVDNKDELKAILDQEFGVLSIYQYYSGAAQKFSGRTTRVYKRKYSLEEDADGRLTKKRDEECPLKAWPANRQGKNDHTIEVSLPDRSCNKPIIRECRDPGPDHTGIAEAEWDAEAALNQAHEIGQPAGTAIYFGVDFDAKLTAYPSLKKQLVDYFTVVSNKLRADSKQYLVGAYGNGAALELLKRTKITEGSFTGKSLIDLTWFNASPAHDRSALVYNGDNDARFDWDLLQSRVAIDYPSASAHMSVDLNIQSKKNAGKYVGFWNRSGRYQVPETRTAAIFDQRRFVCNGMSFIHLKPGGAAAEGLFCGRKSDDAKREPKFDCDDGLYPGDKRSRICFGAVTRVGAKDGNSTRVDCDEDGTFEGWTASDNLGRTMQKRPIWVDGRVERRGMTRDRTACDK